MAAKRITIEEFISIAPTQLVIDVRSPSEYAQAHYPNAVSIPLFSDEERKVVGTNYKKVSRQEAIKIGLDYFGVKMRAVLEEVENLLKEKDSKTVIVHCWRGGMRSGAVAWLLDLYGFKVFVLEGGYKAFRTWAIATCATPYPMRILSGYTGSGKTEILHELSNLGEAMIDLEEIAGHKGSAFGGIGMPVQKSSEQFENDLAIQLSEWTQGALKGKTIWLESESSRIGYVNIPFQFFNQLKEAPRLHIEIPFEPRLNYIVTGYGVLDNADLIASVERIKKRLGGLETKNTIAFLEQNDMKRAFEYLLIYYDRFYDKSKSMFQEADITVELSSTDAKENAQIILNELKDK